VSLVVPPRYTEDEPEISAWLKRADSQQATDGDYGLYRVDIAPAGGGPGPHFHRAMSEAFFVQSARRGLELGASASARHVSRSGRR
jgi:hypothetical protein